jgi:hypothetical protein
MGVAVGSQLQNGPFLRIEPALVRACSHCGQQPALIRSMLDPRQGRTVRMFKCQCGEQTWREDKA